MHSNFCQIYADKINKPTNYNENTHKLLDTVECEVHNIIMQLKNIKSPGHDSIRSETLKIITNEIKKAVDLPDK